mmetsp:Transcript_37642/g.113665  ORF Transcript_37642/g.113665 Transcript_37642/m.113665 type:complete len:241 (-) Transcript_37642:426-1148(-)
MEPASSPQDNDGDGNAGSRAVSEVGVNASSFAIRVSFSSANAWAVRPIKRATSTVPGKDTDAKLQVRACATTAPVAPCFEKKRISSASSRSAGSPARMSLSPNAWQSNRRFGRGAASSATPVRGRSSVKQPRTERLDRDVLDRNTSLASASGQAPGPLASSASATAGMQKVTSSPTASRTWPQALLRTGTSVIPCALAASSLAMAPGAPSSSVPSAPTSAGKRTTTPGNLRRRFTRAAWG